MDNLKGRFAQLLSPKVADEQMRAFAKAMLQVKGVNVTKPAPLYACRVCGVEFKNSHNGFPPELR